MFPSVYPSPLRRTSSVIVAILGALCAFGVSPGCSSDPVAPSDASTSDSADAAVENDGETPDAQTTDVVVETSTDAGADSAVTTIGAGPYSIAYSSAPGIGIDQRPAVTAVVGTGGELESYEAAANEKPSRGTNQVGEVYMDAFSMLGRWNGGTTAGVYYASPSFTYSASQGFHYGLVVQSAALPTSGTVAYNFAKATAATIGDGTLAAGVVTAKAAVLFQAATRKTAIELTITMPSDGTYTATTAGGVLDPSQSTLGSFNNSFNGDFPVTGTGAACMGANPCKVAVRGFVGGGAGANSAARLVLVFVLGTGNNDKSIRGAAVFKAP